MERVVFENFMKDNAALELDIRERIAKIHADVNQHYDEKPYFYHLDKVARLAYKYLHYIVEKTEDIIPVIFAAYFHDSIEDARLTYNDVMKIGKEYMNDKQALLATEIVYALTNEKGRNRHERANEKYYFGIRVIPYAPLVKACDRLANYNYAKETHSRMVSCYEKEMDYFVGCITPTTENDIRFTLPTELVAALFNKE